MMPDNHYKCRICGSEDELIYSEDCYNEYCAEVDYHGEACLDEYAQAFLHHGNICESCANKDD